MGELDDGTGFEPSTTGFILFTLLGFEPASHSSYRAKGVEGFRLVTAQELFSKCIYLGFEIPQEQFSLCFGFLSATAF